MENDEWVMSEFVTVALYNEAGEVIGRTWVKVENQPICTAVDILTCIDNKFNHRTGTT